jgi:hypothetical protein
MRFLLRRNDNKINKIGLSTNAVIDRIKRFYFKKLVVAVSNFSKIKRIEQALARMYSAQSVLHFFIYNLILQIGTFPRHSTD